MESKLTESEFAKLQELKKSNSDIILTLGELNFQKTILEFQIEDQSEKIKDLKKEESILFEQLRQSYGNVVVNIETGELSPQNL
jgi:predicted nuclease with TOPRIM domain